MPLNFIDELNNMKENDYQEYFQKYFSVMDISKIQEDNRIEFSKEMKNIMIDFLIFVLLYINYETQENLSVIENQFKSRYKDLVSKYNYIDSSLSKYIDDFSEIMLECTLENYDKKRTFSSDRVLNIAVNEANSIFNYSEYKDALINGKTSKTWITRMDNKERDTHKAMRNITIPIYDLFQVGDAEMRYPHDIMAFDHPEELAGCRCSIIYK